MNELLKDLTLEMIPEGLYKQIAEEIGISNFYKLAEVVGGATVYIPKPESILRPARDARIKGEFNGYNHPKKEKKYKKQTITKKVKKEVEKVYRQ